MHGTGFEIMQLLRSLKYIFYVIRLCQSIYILIIEKTTGMPHIKKTQAEISQLRPNSQQLIASTESYALPAGRRGKVRRWKFKFRHKHHSWNKTPSK